MGIARLTFTRDNVYQFCCAALWQGLEARHVAFDFLEHWKQLWTNHQRTNAILNCQCNQHSQCDVVGFLGVQCNEWVYWEPRCTAVGVLRVLMPCGGVVTASLLGFRHARYGRRCVLKLDVLNSKPALYFKKATGFLVFRKMDNTGQTAIFCQNISF